MDRPLTAREIIRRNNEPMFDVYEVTPQASLDAELAGRPERTGDVVVRVTNVREPFMFLITAEVVQGAAPFGKPTRELVMKMAQDFARQQLQDRLMTGG